MTNNPFDKFEIDHLSASSINLFISNPSQWILRYLFGIKWEGNAATTRGTIVDEATGRSKGFYKTKNNKWVRKKNRTALNKNLELSFKGYDSLIAHLKKHNTEFDEGKAKTERDNLQRYIETSVAYYKELKGLVDYQVKIELQLEELPIPIIGYSDMLFEDTVRDIKTVSRMPSVVPSPVNRQLAIYAAATGKVPIADYVYVTKTKAEVRPIVVDDVDKYLEEVKRAAMTIMNVLSYSDDKTQIANLYFPDLDQWQWTNKEREAARQIWSIN